MAITQNVKYIVEVDASALARLKTEVDQVRTCLDDMEASLKRVSTSLNTTNRAVSSLTSRLGANAAAVDRSTMAIMNQGAILRPFLTGLDRVVQELANINAQNMAVISSTRQVTSAMNSQTAAINQQKAATQQTERATNDMSFLKLFGKFQAIKWIAKETFGQILETAENMDLDRVLGRQLTNYQKIFEETKQKTGGIVADNDIRKSMALMSSFGIDMAKYADSMELVQKMAVRTGQSAEYLTQSFARGISRLSPLILDNLGIQVSLKDANEEYAKSVGKSTDELTKAERTTALMNQVLEKLRTNTEGVDIENAVSTPWKKAMVTVENAWEWLKEKAIANPINNVVQAFESDSSAFKGAMEPYVTGLKVLAQAGDSIGLAKVSEHLNALNDAIKAMGNSETLADLVDVVDSNIWDLLGITGTDDREKAAALMFGPDSEWARAAVKQIQSTTGMFTYEWEHWYEGKGLEGVASFQAIAGAAEEVRAAAAKMLEPYDKVLSAAQKKAILDNLSKAATTDILNDVTALVEKYNGNGPELIRQLGTLKLQDATLKGLLGYAKGLAEVDAQHAKQSKEANARSEAALQTAAREFKVYEDMQKLQEGKTLTEAALIDAQEKENELATKLKKAWTEVYKTRDEGQKEVSLEEVKTLKAQLDLADKLTSTAKEKADAEIAYFKKWKDASDVQLLAESTRLLVNANLLRVMNAQLSVAQNMPGAVKAINDIIMATNEAIATSMGNTAKRLMANYGEKVVKDKGPGYRPPGAGDAGKGEGGKEYVDLYAQEMRRRLELAKEASKLLELPDYKKFNPVWTADGSGEMASILGMDPEEIRKAKAQLEDFMTLRAKLPEQYQAVLGSETGFTPAYLEYMNAELEKMNAHLAFMSSLAEKLNQVGTALDDIGGGMDGLFGNNYVSMVNELASAMDTMANAMQKNNDAYGQALAGMGVVRAFTKNLINSRRQQAGVEAAMQAAASWAAAATGNVPAAIAHGIAAAMYGGVALKVFRLPKGKETEDKPNQKVMEKSKRGDVHIHISGPIALTEAERGAMIKDAIAQADRAGL